MTHFVKFKLKLWRLEHFCAETFLQSSVISGMRDLNGEYFNLVRRFKFHLKNCFIFKCKSNFTWFLVVFWRINQNREFHIIFCCSRIRIISTPDMVLTSIGQDTKWDEIGLGKNLLIESGVGRMTRWTNLSSKQQLRERESERVDKTRQDWRHKIIEVQQNKTAPE